MSDHDLRWLLPLLWFAAGFAIGLILAMPVHAADDAYCELWSREQTRIEVLTGTDVDTATMTPTALLEKRAKNYFWCRGADIRPLLEGEDGEQAWVTSVYEVMIARAAAHIATIGSEPASDNPRNEAWREACAREYASWNPDTETVIRKGSSTPVRCPCGKEVDCG